MAVQPSSSGQCLAEHAAPEQGTPGHHAGVLHPHRRRGLLQAFDVREGLGELGHRAQGDVVGGLLGEPAVEVAHGALGEAWILGDLLAEVRREVAVIVPPEWHRFPNSFSHIFAGGYGAGYFSYKWAEVLSADCYAAFEEAGDPFDPETGRRFLDEIIAIGGSRAALDNFPAFRGREPKVDALLRHSRMIAG